MPAIRYQTTEAPAPQNIADMRLSCPHCSVTLRPAKAYLGHVSDLLKQFDKSNFECPKCKTGLTLVKATFGGYYFTYRPVRPNFSNVERDVQDG
jgi:hypothetical protein